MKTIVTVTSLDSKKKVMNNGKRVVNGIYKTVRCMHYCKVLFDTFLPKSFKK